MSSICVVDDKEILRESLSEALVREDHVVTAFADPVEALVEIKKQRFDVILSDLKMPRMDGISLIRETRSAGCHTPIIMMTGFATVATAVEAMKIGAFDYIQKPFEADAVVVLIERALEHARLRRENEALRVSMEDLGKSRTMVGSSTTLKQICAQLDRVAQSDDTVLITGESGTGKELAAHYIHRMSLRAERPMLCLNCAALSASLLESELFGHERGAFTGADRARKGRFELADGGTLLLDEVSEMALGLQAKLLRVLQEGEFERVGSSTTRRANVRILATTNRDLDDSVRRKRFRADLFYRLNVLPIPLAPLRDRTQDIPELAAHFLGQVSASGGGPVREMSKQAMAILMAYGWPGNVRELENICRRAATLSPGPTIEASLLTPWLVAEAPSEDGLGKLRDGRMLEDMERHLIERMLQKHGGHRARTAKSLGMGVRTLGMKLKQWREESEAAGQNVLAAVAV